MVCEEEQANEPRRDTDRNRHRNRGEDAGGGPPLFVELLVGVEPLREVVHAEEDREDGPQGAAGPEGRAQGEGPRDEVHDHRDELGGCAALAVDCLVDQEEEDRPHDQEDPCGNPAHPQEPLRQEDERDRREHRAPAEGHETVEHLRPEPTASKVLDLPQDAADDVRDPGERRVCDDGEQRVQGLSPTGPSRLAPI